MNAVSFVSAASDQSYRHGHNAEVKRRVALLGNHRMLSCAEALLRLQAAGLSQRAALQEVRAQRSLFYVQFIDVAYFPAFQWRHVRLRPCIAPVLELLEDRTKWQIALWFVEESPVLNGLRPIDVLDLPSVVVAAASAETCGVSH